MRKISACMATQHPDNAGKPYWNSRAFISTTAEIKECYLCFSDLGIDEYNWDWEGKFVDEAVVDKFLHKYFHYFKKHPLGKENFLTFRIPNPRVEKQFRLARAFMVIVTSSQLAQSLNFDNPPIFETILPLTETAEEIIEIQEAFRDLVRVEHKLLKMKDSIQHLEIIPLFEQVGKIAGSAKILEKYITLHKKTFGFKPAYLRPYCARSDPALNSGLVPTVIALKIALSSYRELEDRTNVKLYPMLGTGSLPFRGSLRPDNIENALAEYAGVKTLTIQSAFRYDYPLKLVKSVLRRLKEELPKKKAKIFSQIEVNTLHQTIPLFEKPYQKSVEKLAPLINAISRQVAKRRERMLHIGLFGYSRGVGHVSLPRAIPFCASLYSLGIPPELIGTGRGIKAAKKLGFGSHLAASYLHLKEDIVFAGNFFNRENLMQLAKHKSFWYDIMEDIKSIEKELGFTLGPKDDNHFEHYKLTQKVYERLKNNKDISQLITYTGVLRKSLG
ncbi:phosphoenolpyruvate carboxylase [Candidatus Gottesmanbacteria bacterium]|nr:phosphoenolpyruvate carboxylase [Candidatus Gottesmanbacteria bacterium]